MITKVEYQSDDLRRIVAIHRHGPMRWIAVFFQDANAVSQCVNKTLAAAQAKARRWVKE